MRLYHGTTTENAAAIRAAGKIEAPAYFVADELIAGDYGEEIIAVDVPAEKLRIDLDLPGGRLLDVDDANTYTENDWTIADYIDHGYAVGIEDDLTIH